jgi:hypothetical protein
VQLNRPTLVIVSGAPASAAGRFDPLDLPVPTMVVDTTDGLAPAYDEVRRFAGSSFVLPATAEVAK